MNEIGYKVLWVDDEPEETYFNKALNYNITLHAVESAEEALEKLNGSEHFDAVILDGLFHNEKGSKGDPSSDGPFGKIAVHLIAKNAAGQVLPWFILSGKTRFTVEQNTMVNATADKSFGNGKVFNKKKVEDLEQLWREIIEAVDSIPERILRHKYSRVLEMCTGDYLGKDLEDRLLHSITNSTKDDGRRSREHFLPLRKILESLFEKLNKIGLIPDSIYQKKNAKTGQFTAIDFNPCADFLSGNGKPGLPHLKKDVIHPTVSNLIRQLKEITQDAEHNQPKTSKLKVDEFVTKQDTNYLYVSMLNQLVDVLIWFKTFIDEHPDKQENLRLSK